MRDARLSPTSVRRLRGTSPGVQKLVPRCNLSLKLKSREWNFQQLRWLGSTKLCFHLRLEACGHGIVTTSIGSKGFRLDHSSRKLGSDGGAPLLVLGAGVGRTPNY
jgi:hypothetical protein